MFSIIKYLVSQYPWYFSHSVIDVGCGTADHAADYLDVVSTLDSRDRYSVYLIDKDVKSLEKSEEVCSTRFQNSPANGELEIKTYNVDILDSLNSVLKVIDFQAHSKFFGPTVICTEVAEHLKFKSEDQVSEFIWNLIWFNGPIIFSAAPPYQGGDGHVWCKPASYWIEKFSEFSYTVLDFREHIWHLLRKHPEIPLWRVQNTLMFVPQWTYKNLAENFKKPAGGLVPKVGIDCSAVNVGSFDQFDIIHPIFIEAGINNGWFVKD